MDPSIMKLLEEDEDETMHSGADVEAFTAALNRDIEGDTSISHPSDSDTVSVSQGNNQIPSQLYSEWQPSNQDEHGSNQSQQVLPGQQVQRPSDLEGTPHGSGAETQVQELHGSQTSGELSLQHKQTQDSGHKIKTEQGSLEVPRSSTVKVSESSGIPKREPDIIPQLSSESQFSNMEKFNSQQTAAQEQANAPINRSRQIPFGSLLPIIIPELDKERAMQLNRLYAQLRKNEIPKESFVRLMRGIVGDQMLRLSVLKMQAKAGRTSNTAALGSSQPQNAMQQHHSKQPSSTGAQFSDPFPFTQQHQAGQSAAPMEPSRSHSSSVQVQKDSGNQLFDSGAKKLREVEHAPDTRGMQANQMPDHSGKQIQGLNKVQQQHLHFPQASFPMFGSGSNHPYGVTTVNKPSTLVKQPTHDSQLRQAQIHQGFGSTHVGGTSHARNMMNIQKFEKQTTSGSFPHVASNSAMQQDSVPWQTPVNKEQKSSTLPSAVHVKREPVDQAIDQGLKPSFPSSQGSTSVRPLQHEQGNAVSGAMNDEISERPPSKMTFSTSTSMAPPNSSSSPMGTVLDNDFQHLSAGAMVVGGNTAKTTPKKPSVGQKKPLDTTGSSPPIPSKKQKVTGASVDQSIEQLNDVTAVSGVNLREEEEQLFSGPKDDSRVSEASRKVVQEEEERLLLQKIPLQKKLAEITSKCGVQNLGNDVERCLSLCVEERLRGLISNLIRVSKQRADSEKSKHRAIITSDVRQHILAINRSAREEWDKKQAEAEKNRKATDPDGSTDGDKEKDDGRGKSIKVNKEEDDKMRTTAANVAARAAVGGDDMLSKWQLMAEQARQKREGGTDGSSSSQPVKDASHKSSATTLKNQRDYQGEDKRDASTVPSGPAATQFGRSQVPPQEKVTRTISMRDLISVLEREPQMSKSTLLYRLYEKKVQGNSAAE